MRLRDVPTTIGWDAVALFLRHLPYDSEVMRESDKAAMWSPENHMLANIADMVGGLFSQGYEPLARPGDTPAFSTAEPVGAGDYEMKLSAFRKGAADA